MWKKIIKDTENCTKKFGRCFAKNSIGFDGAIPWFYSRRILKLHSVVK